MAPIPPLLAWVISAITLAAASRALWKDIRLIIRSRMSLDARISRIDQLIEDVQHNLRLSDSHASRLEFALEKASEAIVYLPSLFYIAVSAVVVSSIVVPVEVDGEMYLPMWYMLLISVHTFAMIYFGGKMVESAIEMGDWTHRKVVAEKLSEELADLQLLRRKLDIKRSRRQGTSLK